LLKVGGKRDIAANSIVCPATVAAFTETAKTLLSFPADVPGLMLNWIICHDELEEKVVVVEPRALPEVVWSAKVKEPVIFVEGALGKR
jgi:hypothetical protein